MEIIKDKDLIFYTDKYDVILVGTSIYNMLTQGFQSKMTVKYPYIVDANNSTNYADTRKYGKRITVEKDGNPTVSIMYICGYPNRLRDFLKYDALENCLKTAAIEFKGKKIAAPFLGTSLFDGNGDRDRCLDIISTCMEGTDFTLYDFKQYNRRKEIAMVLSKWNKYKYNKQWNVYNELLYHKDEFLARLYLKH